MKVSTTTKYGGSASEARDGFKIAATAEISDAQLPILASIGLASILYRGGASVMNEALGVQSNSKAEFSEADATKLCNALGEWAMSEDSPLKGGFDLETTITKHVHGEGTAPVYKEEKRMVGNHVKAGDIETWATEKVGFTGGDLNAENVEFLKAVKAYKQRILNEG